MEGDRRRAGAGKPATPLDFDPLTTGAVAFDLSDDAVVTCALISAGNAPRRVLTRARVDVAPEEMLVLLTECVTELRDGVEGMLSGVGIGVPGGARATGALGPRLAAELGTEVLVADDADLAADAEMLFGDIEARLLLVRLNASIRITTRAPSGGSLLRSSETARQLAHVGVGAGDEVSCACGRANCVHTWAAAPALKRRLRARAHSDHAHILREAGGHLAVPLGVLVSMLGTPEIVLSGPDEALGDELIDAVAASLRAHTEDGATPVVRRSTVSHAVLRGAALRVLAHRFVRA